MDQPRPDDEDNQHGNLGALLVVAVLVALAVFLMLKLKEGIALQDCFAQGRKDCAPIDTSKM